MQLLSYGRCSGVGMGFGNAMLYIIFGFAFWFGGLMVKQGHMDFGEVLKVSILNSHLLFLSMAPTFLHPR